MVSYIQKVLITCLMLVSYTGASLPQSSSAVRIGSSLGGVGVGSAVSCLVYQSLKDKKVYDENSKDDLLGGTDCDLDFILEELEEVKAKASSFGFKEKAAVIVAGLVSGLITKIAVERLLGRSNQQPVQSSSASITLPESIFRFLFSISDDHILRRDRINLNAPDETEEEIRKRKENAERRLREFHKKTAASAKKFGGK